MQVFGVSPETCFCLSKTNDTFLDQPMTVLERVRAQICVACCAHVIFFSRWIWHASRHKSEMVRLLIARY